MGFGVLYVAEWMRRAAASTGGSRSRAAGSDRSSARSSIARVRSCSPASCAGCARPASTDAEALAPADAARAAGDQRRRAGRGRLGGEGAAPPEERAARRAPRAGHPRGARDREPSADPRRAPGPSRPTRPRSGGASRERHFDPRYRASCSTSSRRHGRTWRAAPRRPPSPWRRPSRVRLGRQLLPLRREA